jgi:hypothetical protein
MFCLVVDIDLYHKSEKDNIMDKHIEKLIKISEKCAGNFTIENPELLKICSNDNGDLDIKNLYFSLFSSFPNEIIFREIISGSRLRTFIIEHYEDDIKDCRFSKDEKNNGFYDYLFYLFDDLLLYHDRRSTRILFRKTPYEKIEKLIGEISKCKQRDRHKPEISLICNSLGQMETTEMYINPPKLDLSDNYNDDFLSVHETIISRLRKKNDKGVVLLHGKPGTGKTSYLRYLITQTRKQVIFLPPNMADSITEPGLVELLIENRNSIFVIEDAENILIDRNSGGSSAVSALLNLADGLLSDCLNIQIICSFNTDLARVDSALLRKGRLIANYEFRELEINKAQSLSNKLGFDTLITKPMTLADVYNQHEAKFAFEKKRSTVGFSVAV